MNQPDTVSFFIQLFQGGILLALGFFSLYYHKNLADEMTSRFRRMYGKWFNIERISETRWATLYLRTFFVLFGILGLMIGIIVTFRLIFL